MKMNIAEMYPEDRAQYGPLQEEIMSQCRYTPSSTDYSTSLDWSVVRIEFYEIKSFFLSLCNVYSVIS